MTILIAAREAMTKSQINFCLEIEENLQGQVGKIYRGYK